MVLCGSSSAVIAVSLIIRCASLTSMLQHVAGVVLARDVALEDLPGREDDLVGRLAAAALAAHAVGDDRQRAARHPLVHDDLDLVLLVGPVAAVHAGGGGQAVPWLLEAMAGTIRQGSSGTRNSVLHWRARMSCYTWTPTFIHRSGA